MATWNMQPSKPPEQFPYILPPPAIMIAMRASGASDTQIIACYRYFMRTTWEQTNAGNKVTWPKIGTWQRTYVAARNVHNVSTGGVLPLTAKYRITLRPNRRTWRT